MSPAEQALAAREFAGYALRADRGLIEVTGGDRERWLDGMVTADVASLEPGDERSGCYALLLTRQGRIVADLHVLRHPERFWLETDAPAVPRILEHLDRFIIADDVALADIGARFDRIGLEGPAAGELLDAVADAPLVLSPEAWAERRIAGGAVVVAAFGWSAGPGFQLFAEAGAGSAVVDALVEASQGRLVALDPEALEILRIEAGIPRLGPELDEEVLPEEAGLERAISFTKGCYTGQEVVARLRSRGGVKHKLVALRFAEEPPIPGAILRAGERKTGEVTSACTSPDRGAIGLGYVRVEHAEPGFTLAVEGGGAATVSGEGA